MARGNYEIPDEFLEAADRFASRASELGGNFKEIEPVHRAARREKPQ